MNEGLLRFKKGQKAIFVFSLFMAEKSPIGMEVTILKVKPGLVFASKNDLECDYEISTMEGSIAGCLDCQLRQLANKSEPETMVSRQRYLRIGNKQG